MALWRLVHTVRARLGATRSSLPSLEWPQHNFKQSSESRHAQSSINYLTPVHTDCSPCCAHICAQQHRLRISTCFDANKWRLRSRDPLLLPLWLWQRSHPWTTIVGCSCWVTCGQLGYWSVVLAWWKATASRCNKHSATVRPKKLRVGQRHRWSLACPHF